MVPSTLSVHWRLASDHAALAHLLNYALHKLTGILKALELLGKLLVEWSQRQFLLTGPFWHRLQSSEQVVSDIVGTLENPILLAVHLTHRGVLDLVN